MWNKGSKSVQFKIENDLRRPKLQSNNIKPKVKTMDKKSPVKITLQ